MVDKQVDRQADTDRKPAFRIADRYKATCFDWNALDCSSELASDRSLLHPRVRPGQVRSGQVKAPRRMSLCCWSEFLQSGLNHVFLVGWLGHMVNTPLL